MAHTTKQLNTFHLFAGAGGGVLADILLGHNPIGAAEIEKYPRDVLLARQADGHLPQFPIWDDVATLDGNPWRGSVDILCGGFPCQDISSAGKGAGITGERSGLWKEYARLIGEMRPRFVFAENSPLLRTRGLGVVLEDLAAMGYHARWGVLGAGDVGAPHKRDRMWVLAYDAHSKSTGTRENIGGIRGLSERCSEGTEGMGQEDQTDGCVEWLTDPAEIFDTTSQRGCGRDSSGEDAEDAGQLGSGEGENSSGMEEGNIKPLVGRVADGLADKLDINGEIKK